MTFSVKLPMMRLLLAFCLATGAVLAGISRLDAQVVPDNVLTMAQGSSQLVLLPFNATRVAIGAPETANFNLISPREILVNAIKVGTTTMIVWDPTNATRTYSIVVTIDAPALERQLQELFPGQDIRVSASGGLVIVSGSVTESSLAGRILEIARGTGATVVNNIQVPALQQVLLQVRFAEVSNRSLERLGAEFRGGRSSTELNPATTPSPGDIVGRVAEGAVDLFLFQDEIQLSAIINALNRMGTFRSLAEPNLLAIEGQAASFLAGGEFPYPVPQTTGTSNATTIAFREFGVKLDFTATIGANGNIRLLVAPEVSSLDFASGIQIAGFNVPALLTRKAETAVELRSGQTFAIAGLLDNNAQRTRNRIPFLGDIPLIGLLFRNREISANRTELLVLVTPRIVSPLDTSPAVPTGEPDTF